MAIKKKTIFLLVCPISIRHCHLRAFNYGARAGAASLNALRAFVAMDSSFRLRVVIYACLSQPGLQNNIISLENKNSVASSRPSITGWQTQMEKSMKQGLQFKACLGYRGNPGPA